MEVKEKSCDDDGFITEAMFGEIRWLAVVRVRRIVNVDRLMETDRRCCCSGHGVRSEAVMKPQAPTSSSNVTVPNWRIQYERRSVMRLKAYFDSTPGCILLFQQPQCLASINDGMSSGFLCPAKMS